MRMKLAASCFVGSVMAHPAVAQAQSDVSLELQAGAFYDSQMIVEEIDLQDARGDAGFRFGAGIEFQPIDENAFELELGYKFGRTIYAELDQFNLQSQIADVAVATTVAGAKIGAKYTYRHYRLDGESLLDSHSITPSISGFVADGLFARGYYTYADKDFDLQHGRDGEAHQVGLAVFKFYSDNAGFVSLHGNWEKEEALDPQFAFDGLNFGADIRLPLADHHEGPHLDLGASYRDRDYVGITPAISEVRIEDRLRGKAEFTMPVNHAVRLKLGYRYTDRSSNLPSADYVEHRVHTTALVEL